MIMAALCCARRPVVLQLDEKPFYCVVAQHQQMCLHSLYYLSLTSCQHVRVETIGGLPQRRVGQGMQLLKSLDVQMSSEQKGNRWTLPLRVECHTASKFNFLFFGYLLYKKWLGSSEMLKIVFMHIGEWFLPWGFQQAIGPTPIQTWKDLQQLLSQDIFIHQNFLSTLWFLNPSLYM